MKKMLIKQKFLLLLLGCMLPLGMYAQQLTVSGTVTDASDGMVLPGVTVVVKGTQTGTITSPMGDYSLQVNVGDVLQYSFIGFNAEERIIEAGASRIDVALSTSVIGMDEVVVIGYGSVRKSDLSGSVVAIKAEEQNRGAVSSAEQLLQGKVAGLFVQPGNGGPGSGSSIRIRGGASLNASNDPLIVIDGVPVSNDAAPGASNALATINPNDIETYTVLKDASATAIYGSRASNGVIIITTKKGSGDGLKVNYSSTYSMKQPHKQIDVLSPAAFRSAITDLWSDGSATGDAALALLNQYEGVATDWQDEIFQTGLATDQNISLSGSAFNTPVRVSLGYYNEKGTLHTSKMERYTGGVNINPKFFEEHLNVLVNVKGTRMDTRFADSGAVGSAAFYDPTKPVLSDGVDGFNGYYNVVNSEGNPNTLAPVNPLSLLEDVDNFGELTRSIGNIQLDYKLHGFEDLSANLNLGYDWTESKGDNFVNPGSFQAAKDSDFRDVGQGNRWSNLRRNKLLDFYLNYKKDMDVFPAYLDVMAGYSWQHFYYRDYNRYMSNETESGNKDGWQYDEELSRYVRDGSRRIPYENYLVSFFGRMNFSVMDRYLLTATFRRDGSSRFNEENRWGFFPSAALAWTVSNEGFMQDQTLFSSLKLRLGYGITGQQEIDDNYGYIPSYIFGSNPNSTYLQGQLPAGTTTYLLKPGGYNPDLRWEETATTNVAIDYGFLNNRINGSIEYYQKSTKDLLNTVDAPAGTNFVNRITANVGTMENKGLEFNINAMVVRASDFSWELGYNFTWNESEITQLTANFNPNYPGVAVGDPGFGTGVYAQRHLVGYTPNTFFLYQQVYDADGKPIQNVVADRDGDGQITDGDRYLVHNPMPRVFMGMSSQFTYKQWDLGFNLRANIDNYVFNAFAADNSSMRNFTNQGYLNNIYQGAVDNEFTQLNTLPQRLSDMFLENASFLRMDNITLGYSFGTTPNSLLSGRISASMENVFVLTNYSGLDPENEGIDSNIWPRPQTFTLGLNLNF